MESLIFLYGERDIRTTLRRFRHTWRTGPKKTSTTTILLKFRKCLGFIKELDWWHIFELSLSICYLYSLAWGRLDYYLFESAALNKALLPDNFSTASRLQNCRKALRYTEEGTARGERYFLEMPVLVKALSQKD